MSKKYIKINLNQVVSRFQMEEMRAERNRWYIAGTLIFCFLCSFSFMSYTNYKINNLVDIRQNHIDGLNRQINDLKKEGQIN